MPNRRNVAGNARFPQVRTEDRVDLPSAIVTMEPTRRRQGRYFHRTSSSVIMTAIALLSAEVEVT